MGLISAIFSVMTVVIGGVCIMVLVSTKTLRESRDDFAVRIKQLEDERVTDKATIESLKSAVEFWKSAATGDAKLDGISALLDRHHQDAVVHWVQVNAGLSHVGTTLDHLPEAIVEAMEK